MNFMIFTNFGIYMSQKLVLEINNTLINMNGSAPGWGGCECRCGGEIPVISIGTKTELESPATI